MATSIYLTVEGKILLETLTDRDQRTQVDEIIYLMKRRVKELDAEQEKENAALKSK